MFQLVNNAGGHVTEGRHRRYVRGMVSVLACGALVLPSAGAAVAEDQGVCAPSAAWTETIPAKGEPQILVDNPKYVPAVPEESHWEHHPAETATEYQRYSWNPKGQDQQVPPEGSTPDTDDRWQANTTHWNGSDPIGVAFQQGGGNAGDNGSWFFWTATEVVVKEAWDEKVIDQEYVPAKGEPQIWIDNPEYEAAQTIEHPAVTCPAPEPTDPAVEPTDQPTEPVKDQPKESEPEAKTVKETKVSAHSGKSSDGNDRTRKPTRLVVNVTG